jgi:predicted peroxiredoxin
VKKIIIQLWQTSSGEPNLIATPLLLASTAAATDRLVEVHVMGLAVSLFVVNVPNNHQKLPFMDKSTFDLIADAMRLGVKFYVCSAVMREQKLELVDLIDGFEGVIGMVEMLERITQEGATVLTF